jgi:leucyl-tRNA synthetase
MPLTGQRHRSPAAAADPGAARHAAEKLVLMLAPMAPHIAEELWRVTLGHGETLSFGPWPTWDPELAREEKVVLVVQVDGRLRDRLTISPDADEEECRRAALASPRVQSWLEGRQVKDVIVRPPRLVNVVTG